MTDTLDDAHPVDPAELGAVLGMPMPPELLDGLFTPALPGGRLNLRQAFGAYVLALLAVRNLLNPDLAVRVASEAAAHAVPGDDKVLIVAWGSDHRPRMGWFDEAAAPDQPEPLHLPAVRLPVDRMFADFAAALALHRTSAAKGVH